MKRLNPHFVGLALFAFFLNAILPFFAALNPADVQPNLTISADKILICTSAGTQLVSREDLNKNAPTPAPNPHLKFSLCSLAAHDSTPLTLPQDVALATLSREAHTASFIARSDAFTSAADRPQQSRAPPVFLS